MHEVNRVLLGAIAMAFLVIALFFARFWRKGRDRLFLLFALSFLVEGVNRAALAVSERPNEGSPVFYGIRLLAFLLIIAAVADKNRGRPAP
jgi:uncharacterized membrane protein HdeD (DUF308 family)